MDRLAVCIPKQMLIRARTSIFITALGWKGGRARQKERGRVAVQEGESEKIERKKIRMNSGKKANAIQVIQCFGDQFCPVTLEEINKSLTLTKEQMTHFSNMLLNRPAVYTHLFPLLFLLFISYYLHLLFSSNTHFLPSSVSLIALFLYSIFSLWVSII